MTVETVRRYTVDGCIKALHRLCPDDLPDSLYLTEGCTLGMLRVIFAAACMHSFRQPGPCTSWVRPLALTLLTSKEAFPDDDCSGRKRDEEADNGDNDFGAHAHLELTGEDWE